MKNNVTHFSKKQLPEPLYLLASPVTTLDLWEWTIDDEGELAVAEWIKQRGAIEAVPDATEKPHLSSVII